MNTQVNAPLLHHFLQVSWCISGALFSFFCLYLFIYQIITAFKFCACAIAPMGDNCRLLPSALADGLRELNAGALATFNLSKPNVAEANPDSDHYPPLKLTAMKPEAMKHRRTGSTAAGAVL